MGFAGDCSLIQRCLQALQRAGWLSSRDAFIMSAPTMPLQGALAALHLATLLVLDFYR